MKSLQKIFTVSCFAGDLYSAFFPTGKRLFRDIIEDGRQTAARSLLINKSVLLHFRLYEQENNLLLKRQRDTSL